MADSGITPVVRERRVVSWACFSIGDASYDMNIGISRFMFMFRFMFRFVR